MADSSQLLRLLEPAVRPVAQSSQSQAASETGRAAGSTDFDQQLAQARQMRETAQAMQAEPNNATSQPEGAGAEMNTVATASTAATDQTSAPANNLATLSGIDQIENPSLRQLIEGDGQTDNK
jgi:hypothetical protein